MKKNKLAIIIVALCLIIVGILTICHLTARPQIPEHSILVINGDKSDYIDIDNLQLTEVSGQIINGKGDVKDISGYGILFGDAINTVKPADFDNATVVADDEYYAEFAKSEIYDAESVYLLIEDNSVNMCVFGDKNSKRNVSNVVKIILE